MTLGPGLDRRKVPSDASVRPGHKATAPVRLATTPPTQGQSEVNQLPFQRSLSCGNSSRRLLLQKLICTPGRRQFEIKLVTARHYVSKRVAGPPAFAILRFRAGGI